MLTSVDDGYHRTYVRCLVLLREALSSNDSAFAKLVRQGLPATSDDTEIVVSNREDAGPSRPYRKFSAQDLKELTALYEAGESMPKLAEKFDCHRQTIARQLKKAGVTLRDRLVRTPEFDARARALYEQGNSLDEVAEMLGVQASSINRAVRAAGGRLRSPGHQPQGDRWYESPPD